MGIRLLMPVLGNPTRCQAALALCFSAAGLFFFRRLARELLGEPAGGWATVLLAFSPLTLLYASSAQVYAVDLFASCLAGWLAARWRSGDGRFVVPGCAALAATAGFRPSGVTFLLPLLGYALWPVLRRRPGRALAGVLAGAVCWLAWLVPTAIDTGGLDMLSRLNREQALVGFRSTSVFFGAPPVRHAYMLADAALYCGMAAAGLLPGLAAALWRGKGWRGAPWSSRTFFLLWMAPNAALVTLLHCSQPGYLMLTLPPLFLLLSRGRAPGPVWAASGLAVSLALSYFPYERFVHPSATTLPFVLLRATPRITQLVEASQRDIRAVIDSLPGPAEAKRAYCLCPRFEAPNLRTVTFDFADIAWGAGQDAAGPWPAGVRSVLWVCAGQTLPPAVTELFPAVRRAGGGNLYSLWAATVAPETAGER